MFQPHGFPLHPLHPPQPSWPRRSTLRPLFRRVSARIRVLLAAFLVGSAASATSAGAAEAAAPPAAGPLHRRIDRAVAAVAVGPLAPRCSDTDFIRRVHLDLTGVIPTGAQVEAFLQDEASDKRARLIDRLLATPAFARHMAVQFDVMLIERRSDAYVDQKAWERYLIASIAQGKPLDQLYRELVYPDGPEGETPPARKFLLNRDAEPHAMTRDVGRMLFGMDLQCAQCHDHPLIDDYYQSDYYGLHAFLNRTSLFKDPKDKRTLLSERAEGEASFESVFTGEGQEVTQPRVPKGLTLYQEPTLTEEAAYRVKPEKTQAGKPIYSRRQALATRLANSEQFRRNLANRLWGLLWGRGLVHPSDFHYFDNPPVNPALLRLLADALAAEEFRLRDFLRELTLSQTYQRSCEPPAPETLNFVDMEARRAVLQQRQPALEAEVSAQRAAATEARKAWQASVATNAEVAPALTKCEQELAAAQQSEAEARAAHAQAEQLHKQRQQQRATLEPVLVAGRAAQQQLPEEAALRESLAILAKRTDELTAELATAAKTLEQTATGLAKATEQREQREAELQALRDRRVPAEVLAAQEAAYRKADAAFADAHAARRLSEAQIALCNDLLAYPPLQTKDPEQAATVWESIVERWTVQGQVAALKPLTPEQLAVSAMRATGVLARNEAAAAAKVDKEPPAELKADDLSESQQAELREIAVQAEMLNQLRGSVKAFVTQFGGGAGDAFQATVNQALFLGNSPTLNGWLSPAAENLVGRTKGLESSREIAEALTLAVFSRPASRAEQQQITAFLDAAANEEKPDRSAAIAELAWAMLTSNEFRFNH